MTRTTILADESLMLKLRAIAQGEGISLSELIRRALEAYVQGRGTKKKVSFLGSGASGGGLRVSERDEHLLFQDKPQRRR